MEHSNFDDVSSSEVSGRPIVRALSKFIPRHRNRFAAAILYEKTYGKKRVQVRRRNILPSPEGVRQAFRNYHPAVEPATEDYILDVMRVDPSVDPDESVSNITISQEQLESN